MLYRIKLPQYLYHIELGTPGGSSSGWPRWNVIGTETGFRDQDDFERMVGAYGLRLPGEVYRVLDYSQGPRILTGLQPFLVNEQYFAADPEYLQEIPEGETPP